MTVRCTMWKRCFSIAEEIEHEQAQESLLAAQDAFALMRDFFVLGMFMSDLFYNTSKLHAKISRN